MIVFLLEFATGEFVVAANAGPGPGLDVLPVAFGLGGVLLGIFATAMFFRPTRTAEKEEVRSPSPVSTGSLSTRVLESWQDDDVGFLRSDGDGGLNCVSPGLSRLMAGVGPAEPLPSTAGELGDWATAIHPDDRREIALMLRSDELESDETRQIRVRSRTRSGQDRMRWFEIRRLAVRNAEVELILIDQTDRVEAELRRRDQLRNQRLLGDTVDCLANSHGLVEGVSELLPRLGTELDLRGAAWFEPGRSDGVECWESHANWIGTGDQVRPFIDRVDLQGLDLESRLDHGRPVVGLPHHPDLVLIPVVVNGRPGPLLAIESHRHGLWNADTIEMLGRLAELLGRAREREIEEAERESWAATRGWLERSEAIAQLTGGVAHDFNGVLFAVLGRFELLRSRIDDPEVIEQIDFIAQTIQEAKRLGDRLRGSLRGDRDPLRVNVRPELEEIFQTARKLLPKRIRFDQTIQLPEATTSIEFLAPADTLQQVLLNLLVNSRDAVDRHGRILLGSRLLPDGQLEVRVDDDGPGIPAEERERMLQPYETGEASDGVGLGLAVSRRLAEEAGGRLLLEDSPLGGLAARVILPVHMATEEASEGLEEPKGGDSGTPEAREVLVVEDNPVIRDVLVRVLEGMGSSVIARNDAIGVEKTMAEATSIDLLVFDIDLPEKTGLECLRELRERGDLTPCLLITGGLSDPPRIERSAFLRKPFRIEELRVQIQALMAGGTEGDLRPR
ncbi:MAG: hypothetical protein CMJ51_05050 [Planctomycetaceae bacterium]|nr:hypothetical protein [Planctomycetaceae bacterium]